MLVDAVLPFSVVTEATFHHGLRCATCHREIEPGRPFASEVQGIYDNGDEYALLKCVYC